MISLTRLAILQPPFVLAGVVVTATFGCVCISDSALWSVVATDDECYC